MQPSVSVIIPTYNRSGVLRYSVESVLNQTYPVSEVIIVDDGSTDDTATLIEREMREKSSWRDRVRYFYQPNQGQSAANNNGISKAKGEWLGFNANDDLWSPWKLEWQFRVIAKYHDECRLCFTDAWFMNNPFLKATLFQTAGRPDGQAFGVVKDPAHLIAKGQHPIWMQTVIARTDLVHEVGGLDESLRYSEDHDFLFRMALETNFCFVGMPMVLIDRSPAEDRHVGEARNWHKEEFCLRMDQRRFEKQSELSGRLSPETRKLVRQNLSNIHSAWASWHIERGEYEKAVTSLSAAARHGLTSRLAFKTALTRVAPEFMKRLVVRDRQKAIRYDRASWRADETSGLT
jgi:glycosyltransferase involved in cell wall biosynthesis